MAPPTPSRQARKTGQEARHLGFPCKSRNGSENFDRGEPKGEREDGTGFEGDVVSELGRLNDRGMGFGFHRHLYPNSFRMCSGEGFPSIGPSIQDPIDPPTALVPRSLSPGPKGMDRRVSQDSLPSRTHIHKERLGSKPGDKLGWSPGMGVQVGGRERETHFVLACGDGVANLVRAEDAGRPRVGGGRDPARQEGNPKESATGLGTGPKRGALQGQVEERNVTPRRMRKGCNRWESHPR